MKNDFIDIEQEYLTIIKKILKQYVPFKTVWAYGSRVNWTANIRSDLDLTVFNADTLRLGELKDAFAESNLPFSVDIMEWEIIPETFKKNIREKHIVLQEKPKLEGWKEYKLGEVVKTNTSSITNNYPYKKILYLDTGSINCGKIDSLQELDLNKAPSRAKRLVKDQDIIYSTVRPIQRHYGYIVKPPENLVVSTGFAVIETNKKLAEPLFIYNLLSSKDIVETLDSIAEGSTSAYPSLKPTDIENLEILLPPLPEQRAIAEVLSSLDDKIDLLHRQNKTLEAMAETLFRQWFVEEADEGWEEGKLGDVLELVYGKALKDEVRTGTGFPVVGSSGIVGFHSEYLVEGPGIVIGRKGTLGKVIYLFENFSPIDTTYYVKSKKNDSIGLLFEYFLLRTIKFEDMNSDSAVPGLNRDIALSTEIKIPPVELVDKYNKACSYLIEKTRINTTQIRTLEKLRNTLLPKLMSGRARVNNE